jgi:hypothetical protein
MFVGLKHQNEHFADVDSVLPGRQKWANKNCREIVCPVTIDQLLEISAQKDHSAGIEQ